MIPNTQDIKNPVGFDHVRNFGEKHLVGISF